ncbi:MAG: hypothetical protein ACJAYJ_004639 [Saprospiraceae bacterium]
MWFDKGRLREILWLQTRISPSEAHSAPPAAARKEDLREKTVVQPFFSQNPFVFPTKLYHLGLIFSKNSKLNKSFAFDDFFLCGILIIL